MKHVDVTDFRLTPGQILLNATVVGVIIFLCSMLGIWTRPSGLLAAFWPANAVLLGLFVRLPKLAHPLGWGAAFLGYLTADLITGMNWELSVFLTAGNFAGVAMGVFLFKQLAEKHRLLKQPLSIIYLILVTLAASVAAGIVGMAGFPYFFDGLAKDGFIYWFATEWANYLAILPVMLTLPRLRLGLIRLRRKQDCHLINLHQGLALLALILGMGLGVVIGGPGALAFLVPGLLWCALTYRLFTTALVILCSNIWVMLTISTGLLDLGVNVRDFLILESFRMGLALQSLAPLAVASVMNARNELVEQLRHLATHDSLTHILNRPGLYEKMQPELLSKKPYALLMCDIDHFKLVNDQYGHACGDLVLAEFAKRTSACLRESDIFARVGGEEFCILLTDCSHHIASDIADRICQACSNSPFQLNESIQIDVTVSIGLVYFDEQQSFSIEAILSLADEALYDAKESGRNCVVMNLASA
ncbi:diguanylate cyclase (GGDEF) domain-containing protein [Methylophaga frappieri]|uniref:diguanylate cyclase n=2 Tax=Methylophaga frappieri (strain ATCC BAA-2434 / DSM 25690 / JAM7) TaxID=754477 RepID=I1YLB5_METFJ|nr:diguanylate cyclase (GGDEF) domain-containing protein [Methylophaga frappieri]